MPGCRTMCVAYAKAHMHPKKAAGQDMHQEAQPRVDCRHLRFVGLSIVSSGTAHCASSVPMKRLLAMANWWVKRPR